VAKITCILKSDLDSQLVLAVFIVFTGVIPWLYLNDIDTVC